MQVVFRPNFQLGKPEALVTRSWKTLAFSCYGHGCRKSLWSVQKQSHSCWEIWIHFEKDKTNTTMCIVFCYFLLCIFPCVNIKSTVVYANVKHEFRELLRERCWHPQCVRMCQSSPVSEHFVLTVQYCWLGRPPDVIAWCCGDILCWHTFTHYVISSQHKQCVIQFDSTDAIIYITEDAAHKSASTRRACREPHDAAVHCHTVQ